MQNTPLGMLARITFWRGEYFLNDSHIFTYFLFGPSDLLLGSHMQSLCDALDIPHIEAR